MSPTQHFLYPDTDPRHRKLVEEAVNAQEAEPQDVLAEIEARHKLTYDETRRPLDTAPPMERALWQARQDVLTLIHALRAALVRTPETLDEIRRKVEALPGVTVGHPSNERDFVDRTDALGVILDLARETLATRDRLVVSGWVMEPLPHETAVRSRLATPSPTPPEGLRWHHSPDAPSEQDVLAEIEARHKLTYDETRRPLDTAPPMERALWQERQDVLTLIHALRAALVRTPETLDVEQTGVLRDLWAWAVRTGPFITSVISLADDKTPGLELLADVPRLRERVIAALAAPPAPDPGAGAVERLQQALRVATHRPHDQLGDPVEGFPVCSVCGAIQTGAATEPADGLELCPDCEGTGYVRHSGDMHFRVGRSEPVGPAPGETS